VFGAWFDSRSGWANALHVVGHLAESIIPGAIPLLSENKRDNHLPFGRDKSSVPGNHVSQYPT
jgi:hypothetical protein